MSTVLLLGLIVQDKPYVPTLSTAALMKLDACDTKRGFPFPNSSPFKLGAPAYPTTGLAGNVFRD